MADTCGTLAPLTSSCHVDSFATSPYARERAPPGLLSATRPNIFAPSQASNETRGGGGNGDGSLISVLLDDEKIRTVIGLAIGFLLLVLACVLVIILYRVYALPQWELFVRRPANYRRRPGKGKRRHRQSREGGGAACDAASPPPSRQHSTVPRALPDEVTPRRLQEDGQSPPSGDGAEAQAAVRVGGGVDVAPQRQHPRAEGGADRRQTQRYPTDAGGLASSRGLQEGGVHERATVGADVVSGGRPRTATSAGSAPAPALAADVEEGATPPADGNTSAAAVSPNITLAPHWTLASLTEASVWSSPGGSYHVGGVGVGRAEGDGDGEGAVELAEVHLSLAAHVPSAAPHSTPGAAAAYGLDVDESPPARPTSSLMTGLPQVLPPLPSSRPASPPSSCSSGGEVSSPTFFDSTGSSTSFLPSDSASSSVSVDDVGGSFTIRQPEDGRHQHHHPNRAGSTLMEGSTEVGTGALSFPGDDEVFPGVESFTLLPLASRDPSMILRARRFVTGVREGARLFEEDRLAGGEAEGAGGRRGSGQERRRRDFPGGGGGDDAPHPPQPHDHDHHPAPTTRDLSRNLWHATFRQLVGSARHTRHNMTAIHALLSVPVSLALESPLQNEELEADPVRWTMSVVRRELLHTYLPMLFDEGDAVLSPSSSYGDDGDDDDGDYEGADAAAMEEGAHHARDGEEGVRVTAAGSHSLAQPPELADAAAPGRTGGPPTESQPPPPPPPAAALAAAGAGKEGVGLELGEEEGAAPIISAAPAAPGPREGRGSGPVAHLPLPLPRRPAASMTASTLAATDPEPRLNMLSLLEVPSFAEASAETSAASHSPALPPPGDAQGVWNAPGGSATVTGGSASLHYVPGTQTVPGTGRRSVAREATTSVSPTLTNTGAASAPASVMRRPDRDGGLADSPTRELLPALASSSAPLQDMAPAEGGGYGTGAVPPAAESATLRAGEPTVPSRSAWAGSATAPRYDRSRQQLPVTPTLRTALAMQQAQGLGMGTLTSGSFVLPPDVQLQNRWRRRRTRHVGGGGYLGSSVFANVLEASASGSAGGGGGGASGSGGSTMRPGRARASGEGSRSVPTCSLDGTRSGKGLAETWRSPEEGSLFVGVVRRARSARTRVPQPGDGETVSRAGASRGVARMGGARERPRPHSAVAAGRDGRVSARTPSPLPRQARVRAEAAAAGEDGSLAASAVVSGRRVTGSPPLSPRQAASVSPPSPRLSLGE